MYVSTWYSAWYRKVLNKIVFFSLPILVNCPRLQYPPQNGPFFALASFPSRTGVSALNPAKSPCSITGGEGTLNCCWDPLLLNLGCFPSPFLLACSEMWGPSKEGPLATPIPPKPNTHTHTHTHTSRWVNSLSSQTQKVLLEPGPGSSDLSCSALTNHPTGSKRVYQILMYQLCETPNLQNGYLRE